MIQYMEKIVMVNTTNNYQRTSRREQEKPRSRRYLWLIVKLALLVLRFLCKQVDLFDGGTGDD